MNDICLNQTLVGRLTAKGFPIPVSAWPVTLR
jgi:hypothetical protein